jgi:hypothetical protein
VNYSPITVELDGGALRLLRDEQRMRQFVESAQRVDNRVCAPGGVILPARVESDCDEP